MLIYFPQTRPVSTRKLEEKLLTRFATRLWEVEGYDHVAAYTHPEYQKRLLDFVDEAMASAS